MTLSQENISLLLISALVLSFSFGMAMMPMDKDGNMSGCPFLGTNTVCQMGISEHIGAFQSMFSGVQVKSVLLPILFIFIIFSYSMMLKGNSPPSVAELFIRGHPYLYNFNKILFAFSDGIIQPKLYT